MSEKHVERKEGRGGAVLSAVILFAVIPALILLFWHTGGRRYYICGTLIMVLAIGAFWLSFERRRPGAREMVVLAVMAAIAVASRAVFIMFPQFKPMAGIVMITAMAFGPQAGFLTGSVSVFASNFIFGQGPWTVWQMFAIGTAGFIAGVLGRRKVMDPSGKLRTALTGALIIQLVAGPILDTSTLFMTAGTVDGVSAGAVYLAGIPFNAVHAAATFLILLLASGPMMDKLVRLRVKYGMGKDGQR